MDAARFKSPALFVENKGQWRDPSVCFSLTGGSQLCAIRDDGLEIGFQTVERKLLPAYENQPEALQEKYGYVSQGRPSEPIHVRFMGSNIATPKGCDPDSARFGYRVGDESRWRRDIVGYRAVRYAGLYDGVDLTLHPQDWGIKYEFEVAPGFDVSKIQVRLEGAKSLEVTSGGDLSIGAAVGSMLEKAPLVYQDLEGGRRTIPSAFRIVDKNTYGFALLGELDASRPLTIDPSFEWSSYYGGSGQESSGLYTSYPGSHDIDIAMDDSGDVYITGTTLTADFPDENDLAYQNVFVASFSSTGEFRWGEVLGDDDVDFSPTIAATYDGETAVFVSWTRSEVGWYGGWSHAFVDRYNETGHVSSGGHFEQFTYDDNQSGTWQQALDITIGTFSGTKYIFTTGQSNSEDIATGGALQEVYDGSWTGLAYVSKLELDGDRMATTYFDPFMIHDESHGYSNMDTWGISITALDGIGVYVGVYADVINLELEAGKYWELAGLNSSLSGLVGHDFVSVGPNSLAASQEAGKIYLINSVTDGGDTDAYVAKYNYSLSSLEDYAYVGGSGNESGMGIVSLDGSDQVAITGGSSSSDFDTDSQTNYGNGDAYLSLLDRDTLDVDYATYIGGTSSDGGVRVAEGGGAVALIGITNSDESTSNRLGVDGDEDYAEYFGGWDTFIGYFDLP